MTSTTNTRDTLAGMLAAFSSDRDRFRFLREVTSGRSSVELWQHCGGEMLRIACQGSPIALSVTDAEAGTGWNDLTFLLDGTVADLASWDALLVGSPSLRQYGSPWTLVATLSYPVGRANGPRRYVDTDAVNAAATRYLGELA